MSKFTIRYKLHDDVVDLLMWHELYWLLDLNITISKAGMVRRLKRLAEDYAYVA